jgi:hypothetical protein
MNGEDTCIQNFGGKAEGQGPIGRPRHRWKNEFRMDDKYIGWEGMDWVDLAQDRNYWWALSNIVMNLWVS